MAKDQKKYRSIGTRPIRHDGVDKVTGRANYGADFALPGMLWGRVLRSPHAHARILEIDAAKALQIEGVKSVITSADLPVIDGGEGPTNFWDLSRNVLARDKVLYHGHAVAAVAATTPEIAARALEQIRVEYDVLPQVQDVMEAISPDAPLLHEDMFTKGVDPKPEQPSNVARRMEIARGDLEKGFAQANVVVEREFTTQPVHQGYIEPHAVVARTGEDGQVMVWCSSQGHFMVRQYSATLLGLDASQIKVIPAEIGGGFGGKTTVYLEPLAILLSQRSGRPVKIVMSREEEFRATGPAPGTRIRAKLGARNDGTLTACEAHLYFEAGAFPGSPVMAACMTMLAPYTVENLSLVGYDICVNKPKTAAYRAPGAPIGSFVIETLVDEVAEMLGIDPLELRLLNAAHEGSQAPYGPKFRRIGYRETLETARAHPQYRTPLERNQGRGVASGFWFNAGMQSSAAVNVNEDGTVQVISPNPDIGGSRVSLALMAAEELGIEVERVRPVVADTETIGYSDLTGGSRVTFATGMAVIEAARKVIEQLRERAAKVWGIDVSQVEWDEGQALPGQEGGEHDPLSLAEIAASANRTGGTICGNASINARGAAPGFATHICDVEVDPETGRVEILRYAAVQDVGKAIHPSYVEGQMQGGVAQGIGWALNEEYIYDEDGVLENPGFLDYRIPVASDLPMIDTVLVEVANPTHPYGVRGVGEVPIVPPLAAVANAVYAATGVRMRSLPISPPRLVEALERKYSS